MTSSASEKSDELLRLAFDGVSRIATVIAYMPPRDRERAFTAAEQSYERAAQHLGRAAARQWASTVLVRLREEVAEVTGRMGAGNELSFPKIISARNDDESPDPMAQRKKAPSILR
jgi:hypothetical protein